MQIQTAPGIQRFLGESAGITIASALLILFIPRTALTRPGGGICSSVWRARAGCAGSAAVRYTVGGIAKNGPEDRGLSERCIVGFNDGPPFMPSLYNNNVQIFQSRDHAVILTEMIYNARIVPLDDRPPLPEEIGQWSGDGRGYWVGDSLVVVSRNFNGLAGFSALYTSDEKVLTERFTRVDALTVDYGGP